MANTINEVEGKVMERKNQVLTDGFRKSRNFWVSDQVLNHHLKQVVSGDALNYMAPYWEQTGRLAATEMDELSMLADQKGPELIKRNSLGENIDEIRFHPAYNRLLEIAVDSRMMRVKWEPSLRKKFLGNFHAMGFGSGYLFAMSESGQYCPLCMTDGVALLIDRFCEPEDQTRLLPGIAAENVNDFLTGAMFLTEKAGGSDVGANLVSAKKAEGRTWLLEGEKWFCSNANAEIIFALARTDPEKQGTRGLSIFLVEPRLPDGSRNAIDFVRLKEKLGVRSMASAECIFRGAEAKLVGEEFQGFRIMAEMINLSRLYNSVAALSASRRALIEAYQFLKFRITFGKTALEHALVRDKLFELGSLNIANFYLTWRAVEALDHAEQGNESEAQLLRLLTPMVKKWSAEKGVYIVRESMELMGGMGYIEDTVMPKLMRDVMVLPIWEGAGNIMVLDMLRALLKSGGLEVMLNEIQSNIPAGYQRATEINQALNLVQGELKMLKSLNQDEMEWAAKRIFEELTTIYQVALLFRSHDVVSAAWIDPAIEFLVDQLSNSPSKLRDRETIEKLLAWKI